MLIILKGYRPLFRLSRNRHHITRAQRSGTITEIHDYLRLLFARVGEPRCPDHDIPLAAQTVSQMVDNVLAQPEG